MASGDPWDSYARTWLYSRDKVIIEDKTVAASDRDAYLGTIGEEWGTKVSVKAVVADFLRPFVSREALVLDLGCGAGRVARHLRSDVGALVGVDPSLQMLLAARRFVPAAQNLRVQISGAPEALPFRREAFDLVYSFDVMVHFESRLIFRYIVACAELLRPGGRLVVHVATADTPVGLEHFRRSAMAGHTDRGFGALSYQSRTLLEAMGRLARLSQLICSVPAAGHFYCQRDYLAVFEKPATVSA